MRASRWAIVLVVGLGLTVYAAAGYIAQLGNDPKPIEEGRYPHITPDTSLNYLANSPAFDGYADMVSPLVPNGPAALAGPLALRAIMPYMEPWNLDDTVRGINFLIDQVNAHGEVYFPVYDEADIEAEPSKAAAGLLFFPGAPGAPFAMVIPGGGFQALAGSQEAFPYAQRLHEDGYNVFVLHYRVGFPKGDGPEVMDQRVALASDDLLHAMKLIDSRKAEWNVSFDGYSVWGSSAGGTLALQWGSELPVGASANGLPPPSAIITAYPAAWTWPGATAASPALYVTTAVDDPLIPVADIDAVVQAMKEANRPVEYQRNDTGGHGYGLGSGRDAQGWIDKAIAFWKTQSE